MFVCGGMVVAVGGEGLRAYATCCEIDHGLEYELDNHP
jgi:hypothetical protein